MHPASVGPYTILRELGRGGMGEVFLALDTRLEREVAIKALPAHLAQDADRLARFQREAKMLASLNHPGIAAIYGLEEAEGHQYLILEYVDGETLAARLGSGAIPVEEALPLARQIAEALEMAHEKGIVHRDLKPGNVMVTGDGVVKVLDFGLARSGDGPGSSIMNSPAPGGFPSPTATSPAPVHSPTIPGAIMGTAGYMSPEQARGRVVDKRSDIFAFGCVLYEMLTGVMPFSGETAADAIGATLHKELDLGLLPRNTPPRVREMLVSCLMKDRKQRLHDIGDARLELERAIAGKEWTLVSGKARPARRLMVVGLALVVAAGLIAMGAGLWKTLGSKPVAEVEPICVSVAMPADLVVQNADISGDGLTIVVQGRPREATGTGAALSRFYTRHRDSYEFKPVAGTDGAFFVAPTRDSRSLMLAMPVSPGSPQSRLALVPLDGSAPATTVADMSAAQTGLIELSNGDLLFGDETLSFFRVPKGGGAPSAPVKLDAGRPGVVRFEFWNTGTALPGDHSALINVVSYGSRGFQYSVGVLDVATGKVKVIVEDGGNATWSPTGHLVFSRGGVILAAPFDVEHGELRGAPVAIWGGIFTPVQTYPGFFHLTDQGTLCYVAGQAGGGGNTLGILGEGGKVEPWSAERFLLNNITPSPDGGRVICQIVNGRNIDELWISPVDKADLVKIRAEANADSFRAIWSPDGGRITFLRVGKDDQDGIYIQNTDGGGARRIYKSGSADQFISPTAWLADGGALLVERFTAGKMSILRLPIGEKEADLSSLVPFLPSDFNRNLARLSNDGKLLAFRSEESGKAQTWVTEMRPNGETGRLIQVKTAGTNGHAWGADGKTLYVQDERNKLMKVTVSAAPQLAVTAPIEVADLDKLGIKKWMPLPGGRFFVSLKNEAEEEVKQYNMVLNWTEILKKKVPVAK